MLAQLKNWKLYSGKLRKECKFVDFKESMIFVNKVAELITHSIGGLSENDFILAAKIDEVV